MKTIFYLALILTINSCNSSDSNLEHMRINNSSNKIKVFDISADQIYDQNIILIKQKQIQDLDKLHIAFKAFDDSLSLIRDELIEATGGYNEDGLYFNAPAFDYVEVYFYGKSHRRENAAKFFFITLNDLTDSIKEFDSELDLADNLNVKFDILKEHYGLIAQEEIFKNLSINEAVDLIEAFRRKVAVKQYEYILNKR